MRINNDSIMYNTIRLIKEAVGVPYEYIEDADQCKVTIAAIYGILRAAEAKGEVLGGMSGLIDREETIRAWCLMTCGCKPDECGMTLEENGAEECEFVDFLWHRPEYDCTIDPVKHGRWEMGGGYLFPNWTCSRCKCIFCGTEEFPKKYKFCPQCGTRMDEVVEDE